MQRYLRDAIAASVGALVVYAGFAVAREDIMHSTAIEWNDAAFTQEEVRAVRQFMRAPTATLKELELHATTLPAGKSSHAPHRHENEELVIVKEGSVEALVNGQHVRLGPGAVIFNASNEMHSLRNVSDSAATYHVINWTIR